MHEQIFAVSPRSIDAVSRIARGLNLNESKFVNCLRDERYWSAHIKNGNAVARQFQGTPAFAIGLVQNENEVVLKKLILGAQPFQVFEEAINSLTTRSTLRMR